MPLVMFYQRIKAEVVRMFTKWHPFIIEMENNKSHPLSWRGIMTMIIRVMMISLSLLLIFYRPHLLSCAAHGGDFHPSTPFNHQPPLQWRNILTNFYPLNYIFIQCIGWYAQRPFPKFINVESCFGPFLSRSLLSVLVCPCLCLYLHFWTNPISTVCASASFDGINHQLPSATLTPH